MLPKIILKHRMLVLDANGRRGSHHCQTHTQYTCWNTHNEPPKVVLNIRRPVCCARSAACVCTITAAPSNLSLGHLDESKILNHLKVSQSRVCLSMSTTSFNIILTVFFAAAALTLVPSSLYFRVVRAMTLHDLWTSHYGPDGLGWHPEHSKNVLASTSRAAMKIEDVSWPCQTCQKKLITMSAYFLVSRWCCTPSCLCII